MFSLRLPLQVGAFKDFSPEESGGKEMASADQEDEQQEEVQEAGEQEEDEGEEEEVEEASGSAGGDFPPHTVAGLPALSPTMSQGLLPLREPPKKHIN